MSINVTVAIIVVLYMCFMLFIGWYSSKKAKSNTDFMVAGRRLGPLMMAGTLAATEIGGGSSLGVVQNGMGSHGLSAAWYIITMGIAFVLLSFVAPKLRTEEVKTVPEYFRRRYGKVTGFVNAIISFIPLVGLTAGQFIASSVIVSTMLGISYHSAVILVAIVVTVYSVMGGLWAVTLTDDIQVGLIIVGMIVAIPFSINFAGGWENVVANVPQETFHLIAVPGEKGYNLMAVISLSIMYFATFCVGQEAVSRFYAARDGKAAKQGAWLAALLNFIYAFVPTILGIITLALLNMGKFNADEFASVGARYALPILANKVMPPIICGFLFAGIISATMSSSDSDLLGAGSIFGNDIYKQVIRPKASDNEVKVVTQIAMCVVGVGALLIAYFNTSSIVSILTFCFTLRAAGSLFPYVMGMYWKKASVAGTIASLISGTVIVVICENVKKGLFFGANVEGTFIETIANTKNIFGGQAIIPGLIVAFVFFIAFSFIMPPKNETTEMVKEN